MILDLTRFTAAQRPLWSELDRLLSKLEDEPDLRLSLPEIERLHYLYQRAAADLARVSTFSAEPSIRQSLEGLVARAYSEMQSRTQRRVRIRPRRWLLNTCPAAFRSRIWAFAAAFTITIAGAAFGGAALVSDPEAKAVLMPFPHLRGDPSERVASEERGASRIGGHESEFAASLMTHNIRVSLFAFALGITFGAGTVILLFYNGVILGAVVADYVRAGQTEFLLGWLLPHGAIEIPAILIAGQAGFVLATALIGPAVSRRVRLRHSSSDILALLTLFSVMLVWAGLVESFLSQYHAPVLPYSAKIAFGTVELVALALYLSLSGRTAETS